jgi:mannose-6-phosphate isomerase-like protein (cupin superfamily)
MKTRIVWSAVCAVVVSAAWLHSLGPQARAAQNPPPAVLDALFGELRMSVALEALETRATLGAGESQRVVEIARDDASSHHVVAIRDRETPHRHDRHDLLVVMLEGHGAMRLGDEEKPVGQGSIFWVRPSMEKTG